MSDIVGHAGAIRNLVGLSAAIVTVIAIVFAYVFTPVNAKVGHLAHGDTFQCSGTVRISVPGGWYPEPIDRGCQLIRPTYSLPPQQQFLHPARVVINLVETPSVGDEHWRQDVIARLRREGKTVRGITTMTVAGTTAVCFEWNTTGTPSDAAVACNVDKRIAVSFLNHHEKWKSDFNEILRGIEAIPTGTAAPSQPWG